MDPDITSKNSKSYIFNMQYLNRKNSPERQAKQEKNIT